MRTQAWWEPSANELLWRESSGARMEVAEFNAGVRQRALDIELEGRRTPSPRSQVLRIVALQTYSFEANFGGPALSVPLTDVISSVGYRTCVLQLRVHSIDSMPGNCEVSVGILAAARDARDPSTLLLGTGYLVSVGIANSTVSPTLVVSSPVSLMPESFQVVMEAAPNDPGVMTFTIGVDLVLRE